MGKKLTLLIFVFLSLLSSLYAKGKSQAEEIKKQNDEWILCVTEFDIQSVSAEKQVIAGVITKSFVDRMKVINYRSRVSNEYAYYEEYALAKARETAAKSLANKMNERSMLVFSGDPGWKYKNNLAKLNVEIEKLNTDLEEIDSKTPLINDEPLFSLTKGNLEGEFPAAPKAGTEYKFCSDQKADAFLSGSVREFHERFYITIRMFMLYTNSYAYEDSMIFSVDDIDSALDEFAKDLIITLSGNTNALITVRAKPDDALVLINRFFAGKGEVPPLEYPQGKVSVTVSAPDYESMTVETELKSGQITEIDVELKPVNYTDVAITAADGSVYQGALYLGEAPLTLRLPVDTLDYIELEMENKKGKVVFQIPSDANSINTVSIKTEIPPKKGRVENARRAYYWAWGGTWLTGIAAWLSYQTYLSYDSIVRSSLYNNTRDEVFSDKFTDNYNKMYYISMGTMITLGAAVLYEVFQIGRYIYISDKGFTSLMKIKQAEADRNE
ncbi:MAG: PEGA domain-containing protein [Treponema sp.]|jgi:hypothetical protein|nr:PEGA domain-containing protein [Treponema sp.]